VRMRVDGTGSGSYPMTDFVIRGAETLGSVTRESFIQPVCVSI
jgi:hypothetical protein